MVLKRLFYKEADRITPRRITQVLELRSLESRGLCPFQDLYPVWFDNVLPCVARLRAWCWRCLRSSTFGRLFDGIDRLSTYFRSPNIEITVPKEPESVDLDVTAIAGGVVGGVSAVLLIVLGVNLYLRRRRKKKEDLAEKVPVPLLVGEHRRTGGLLTTPTPFLAENSVSTLNESSKTPKWNTITDQSRTTEEGSVIAMTPGSRDYPPLFSRAQEAGLHLVSMLHLRSARLPHLRDSSSPQS